MYKQSLILLEYKNTPEALKNFLRIKSDLNLNQEPKSYLKVLRLIIVCASIENLDQILIDNLEELYVISDKLLLDDDETFKLAERLLQFYLNEIKLE